MGLTIVDVTVREDSAAVYASTCEPEQWPEHLAPVVGAGGAGKPWSLWRPVPAPKYTCPGSVHQAPGPDLRVLAEVTDLVRSVHERLDGIEERLSMIDRRLDCVALKIAYE